MIYVILGQTASGKTSISLRLAKEFSLPVISADAFQCYKMMNIGTDKPTKEEKGNVPFYFYDEYEPDQPVSVYSFQSVMRPVLEKYIKEKKDVLVVGGTFLYIKALLYNYVFEEEEKNQPVAEEYPLEELQKELKEISPKTYEEIDVQNPRRVIRAIRLAKRGLTYDEIKSMNNQIPLYPTKFFVIEVDKEEGNKKIDQRVDKMFSEGFIEEVKHLLSIYPKDLRPFSSIGYKEVIEALSQSHPIDEEVKEKIKVHTHQYAKKQRTFLRNQFKDAYKGSKEEVYQEIRKEILGGLHEQRI